MVDKRVTTRSQEPLSTVPASIRSSAFFEGLPEVTVREIIAKSSRQDYPAGRWVYMQGEEACRIFLLESGLVSLREVSPMGDEVLIRFIIPGEGFGYVPSSQDSYPFSARAVHPSRVCEWERKIAVKLLEEIPKAAARMLDIFASDVIHYYHHTRRLRTSPLPRRVLWGVSELARALGESTPEGIRIERAGLQELAELAGSNIYSVSKELAKLQHRGVLRKERLRILVLQPSKLVRDS